MPQTANHRIDIDVSAAYFFDRLIDFARYPDFLKSVDRIEVVEQRPNEWDLRFGIRVLRQLNYRLLLTATPATDLRWTLVEPGVFLKNDGAWHLEPLGPHKVRAHYRLEVQARAFIPKAITRNLVETTLPEMLGEWKHHAESTRAREVS